MFCGKCGAQNLENATFCKECGAPLNSTSSISTGSDTLPRNDRFL